MPADLNHLFDSSEFSQFLFDNIASAVFILDSSLRVQKVNESFRKLFSRSEQDILQQYCGNAIGCAFAENAQLQCGSTPECGHCLLRSSILRSAQTPQQAETAYISRNFIIGGQSIFKHFRIQAKHIPFAGAPYTIVSVDDVTQLEEQKNQIREMANHDYLTGLYNRRYLYEAGNQLLQLALREELHLAVAIVDIDHFKTINDTHGHQAGDYVLMEIASLLERYLRKSDLAVRYGGEEFCILLNIKGDTTEAMRVLDKLRAQIASHGFNFNGMTIPVTISCGFTTRIATSLDQMIQQADARLYQAKQNGRNRVYAD